MGKGGGTFASLNMHRAGVSHDAAYSLLRQITVGAWTWDLCGVQECQYVDFNAQWVSDLGILAHVSDDKRAAVLYKNSSTIRAMSGGRPLH